MTRGRRPNDRLRELLREAEWTQEAMARAVNALGAEIGRPLRYDRTSVAHWLAGTRPRHPVPQLAAEALSRRIGRPVTPGAAGFSTAEDGHAGGDAVGSFTALCREADTARRAAPRQGPYRVADTAVPSAPGPAPEPAAAGAGGGEAAALHHAADYFAASIETRGGHPARRALSGYLAQEVGPLLAAPCPPRARRELLMAAARLGFLLARMYEDEQLHGLAQRYYVHAHRLASESGDRITWSMVIRAMSAQAQRLGHLSAALRLAEAAWDAARGGPGAQQAYAGAQLAVVLARGGDRRGALRALSRAERAAAGPVGAAAPFDSYPPAALQFQTSAALEALGDLPGALGALRRSAAERADTDLRGRTLTQARFGHLLLRAGHLDEACAAWEVFLAGRTRLRSGDVERAMCEMRRALRPYRNRRGAADLLSRTAPGRPPPRAA